MTVDPGNTGLGNTGTGNTGTGNTGLGNRRPGNTGSDNDTDRLLIQGALLVDALYTENKRLKKEKESLLNEVAKANYLRKRAEESLAQMDRRRSRNFVFCILFAIAALVILLAPSIGITGHDDKTETNPTARATYPTRTPLPTPTLTPVGFPANGTKINYTNDLSLAPFEIKTPTESYARYYYICLCDEFGEKVIGLYVHGGETVEVDVPLGEYQMYYCCGNEWYGGDALFGSRGAYAKSDEMIVFDFDGEYFNGHTISLEKVAYGNFETENINFNAFPK